MISPRFSVIVPIYGVEKYLRRCIDSILAQEYEDYEVILVDDGSKDNCPSICDEYARGNSHIKVIHKTNGGLVSARKAGCAVASGEYIVNVDGDDWIQDGYFTTLYDIAKQYNPDVICFGAVWQWTDHNKEMPYQYTEKYYTRQSIEAEIIPYLFEAETGEYFPPSIWSKAVKRALYQECQQNVDDRIAIGEDVACTRQIIYKADSIYIVKDCLYCYRQNEQSMTKNGKAFSMLTPELVAGIFSDLTSERPDLQHQVSRCISQMFFGAALTQFNKKESYRRIVKELNAELDKPYIQNAIKLTYFSPKFYKGRVALLCLQHRLFLLMKVLNRINNTI